MVKDLKQIIIDGVDVSGCRYYDDRDGYCDACKDDIDGDSFTKCMYEDNCYYKQLKRSEAQCEAMFVSHTDLEKKYKTKEQECEFSNLRIIQLQETLSQYETDLSTKDCIVETCKAQYKELKAQLLDQEAETLKAGGIIHKLEQTLTEIKEIAQYDVYTSRTDLCLKLNWIKKKISECEVEND